ncbi:MAG TPA: DNA polymerase III subunit delta, partial [Candidatus Saccharimonadales bacterium]|nr:DNA polymerase III subunit delta [Candidatus Saccharimonadales bacterium]
MISVFAGSNFYLIKNYVDGIKNDFISNNGDMSVEEVDCEEIEMETLLNALQSLPLFSTKKLVIAKNISLNKKLSEQIEQIFSMEEFASDLIIVEKDIDKRSVYYKFLKKNSDFTSCDEPDEEQSVNWLLGEAKNKGAALSAQDARYLVSRIGLNQQQLENEFNKLINYDKNITKSSIEALTMQSPQSSIFNLIDTAFSGDTEATLSIYEDQKAQGSQPQSIFGMVIWQANIIAAVAAGGNLSPSELSSATGIKPFSISKASRIYKKIGRSGVNNLLDRLVDVDRQMKTRSTNPDELLKNLLVTIS